MTPAPVRPQAVRHRCAPMANGLRPYWRRRHGTSSSSPRRI